MQIQRIQNINFVPVSEFTSQSQEGWSRWVCTFDCNVKYKTYNRFVTVRAGEDISGEFYWVEIRNRQEYNGTSEDSITAAIADALGTKLNQSDKEVFREKCEFIATHLGKNRDRDVALKDIQVPINSLRSRTYEADVVKIALSRDGQGMAVVRKYNNNPVLWIDEDGEEFRFHGEAWKFEDHIHDLYEEVNDE